MQRLLGGLLLLGMVAQAFAADLTVTVTIPDDVLLGARQFYTLTPGTPADDARVQAVLQAVMTQVMTQAAQTYVERLGNTLATFWQQASGPEQARRRAGIQQALEEAVGTYTPQE